MNNYKNLLTMNAEKGIAIVANESGDFAALVNGKLYSTRNGRPLNGDGRQLRDETRNAIADMLPAARITFDQLTADNAAKVDAICAERAVVPQKSFADALQDAFLSTLTEKAAGDMTEMVYPVVEKKIVEKFGIIPQVHEIRIPERPPMESTEILHKDFDTIVSMVMDGEPVYLCGPAGTGKSYLAQQIAKALNLEFYYTNSVTDEVALKGFVDANGRYHETQFYNAFVNGGVFLLDELDASVPETLVLLNNALANGVFAFPNGKATAHPDFKCMAAGNTYGTGADNVYTGRYQLDAASMDRFSLIMVNYDPAIEKNMARGDNDLVEFAHSFRAAVDKCSLTVLFTYRAIKRLAKFTAYMSKEDALRIGLVKGLPADDVALIVRNFSNTRGEWYAALEKLSRTI